ncbi:Macrocin-O-methyltransferase (TylF) [Blastochloris viridis]|uniref:Macrocin-O-methyltransferase (TylF) n=1 Tax=Blastochloris viridis TaxID=1079 RepID=A0A0P0IRS9_BLAVI|nr:Macrocin-O-methyltransferase (TylF) [Blastochloris viridis]CUU42408.1 Macrocin-O-methyltransferase (TylF) [Blastochloris viridis]
MDFGTFTARLMAPVVKLVASPAVMRTLVYTDRSRALVPLIKSLGGFAKRLDKNLSNDRIGYHVVRDHYGASARKLLPLPDLPEFGALANDALRTGRCLLYYDRLFTLYNALKNVKRRSREKVGIVEVGVFKGGTSYFLARAISELALEATLHACDTFKGHDKVDVRSDYDRHLPSWFADASADAVKQLLAPFPYANVHVGRVQETFDQLPKRIGLVHLDVDLYEPTLFCLRHFMPNMVPGGLIVVDDYGAKSCPGVVRAINDFLDEFERVNVVPLDTGQCVLVFG